MTQLATKSSHYTVVPVEQLRVGTVLQAPILDVGRNQNLLLLAKGCRLTNRLLRRLIQRGITDVRVHCDDLAGGRSEQRASATSIGDSGRGKANRSQVTIAPASAPKDTRVPHGDANAFLRSVENNGASPYYERVAARFAANYEQSLAQLNDLFDCLSVGEAVDGKELSAITAEALVNLATDMDLFAALGVKPESDNYPSRHSLQTAMFALSIGTNLGLSERELLELGVGCLVHDVGMGHLDQEIVQADRKLNEVEFVEITKHPTVTFDLLSRVQNIPNGARMVVYQSHERCNGSGYPRQRSLKQIHRLARVAAVADVFLALISPRPHRPGLLPYHAVERLICETNKGLFDPEIVRSFLHTVSLFPLGSHIALNDGRVGKVIRANGRHYTRPVVQVWTPGRLHEEPETVDLSHALELQVCGVLPNLVLSDTEPDLDHWE